MKSSMFNGGFAFFELGSFGNFVIYDLRIAIYEWGKQPMIGAEAPII